MNLTICESASKPWWVRYKMPQTAALDESIDTKRLLILLSCHFSDLAQIAELVEATLSDILTDDVAVDQERLQTLQKLDYLRQALEDSSALVDVLSNSLDVTISDLDAVVKLGATRGLYTHSSSSETEAGTPELF